ncbi:MAG: 50S ribosomal protein L7/L12 [Candidatus Omnitrophica bacterium]|nr:50S ribosomal protein L7/L12 [Candidatus Omnitrophota bacterium]
MSVEQELTAKEKEKGAEVKARPASAGEKGGQHPGQVPHKEEAAQEARQVFGGGTKVSQKLQDLISSIEKMTVLELAEFVKALEKKFGVTAAAPVLAAAPGAHAAAAPGAQAEEKDSFTVVLTKSGDKKIQVIKEIRSMTTLGLKEAKDLVDACPKPVKDGVPKKEAEEMKKKLEAAGATVELK